MDVSPELLFAAGGSLVGVVAWIEKRFRDSKRDADTAISVARRDYTAELNVSTAEHRNTTARLERDLTQLRIDHANELREIPTRDDLAAMADSINDRLNKFEIRLEGVVRNASRRGNNS